MKKVRQNYAEILEHLKTFFPAPTSNPVMDGYFLYTVSHFLDRIDHLKTAAPLLRVEEDGLPQKQSVGVMYVALDAVTCLAEVYQNRRIIYRRWADPWLVAFDLEQSLALLDLTGHFPTQVSASMALMSGPRSAARHQPQDRP